MDTSEQFNPTNKTLTLLRYLAGCLEVIQEAAGIYRHFRQYKINLSGQLLFKGICGGRHMSQLLKSMYTLLPRHLITDIALGYLESKILS